MILKESNLVICQMALIKEVDTIINLLDVTQQELLEDVSKQSFPLLYEMCLENLSKRSEILKKKFLKIKEDIQDIK